MRLSMFMRGDTKGIAAAGKAGFHGLTEDMPGYPGDLDDLVHAGTDLRKAGKALLTAPEVDMDSVRILPPLMRPSKIICVGLNYADHSAEVGFAVPDYPTIFCRFASSLVGHNQPIIKPVQSDQLDYEGEMAVVIGKGGRGISRAKALDHVIAYSMFNDASVRNYQFRTPQWTVGKNFDATGAFGPWLVTADELPPGGKGLSITTRLNGRIMQDSSTDKMMFDVPALVELLSEVMTLVPGDILVTGTPSGVGSSRRPPVYMKHGDVVAVEIEGMGILKNPVIAANG